MTREWRDALLSGLAIAVIVYVALVVFLGGAS